MSGKEENKNVKAENVILGFSIERRKRFLQVEGTGGKWINLISHNECVIDNGHITDKNLVV